MMLYAIWLGLTSATRPEVLHNVLRPRVFLDT